MNEIDKEFCKEVSISCLKFSDYSSKVVNKSLKKGTLDPNLLNDIRTYFYCMFNRLQKLASDKDRQKDSVCDDSQRSLFG